MNKITINAPEMEEATMPLFQTRSFHGYYQYLETFGTGESVNYCWRFYITGFTSDNTHGYIYKWNGDYELIAIDDCDRILIAGKYYGHRYWNH